MIKFHYSKKKNIKTIGICSNKNSLFSTKLDYTLVIPFTTEISGSINKIPTNSCMSQLIFCNILVSKLKSNISLNEYKENHLSGNIGKNLLKVKDLLITDYPKLILEDKISLTDIFLKMTEYKIGCCFFVNSKNKLLGLLTDGDIRRLLIKKKITDIVIDNINKNFYFLEDENIFISEIKNNSYYIPFIKNNVIIGIISRLCLK